MSCLYLGVENRPEGNACIKLNSSHSGKLSRAFRNQPGQDPSSELSILDSHLTNIFFVPACDPLLVVGARKLDPMEARAREQCGRCTQRRWLLCSYSVSCQFAFDISAEAKEE